MDIVKQFFSNINILSNGCYEWTGGTHSSGVFRGYRRVYGQFSTGRKQIDAHIFAYELHSGLEAKNDIHHKCEYTLCVNGEHLKDMFRSDHMKEHRVICVNGHDTSVVGKTKTGRCKQCRRDWDKIKRIR